MAIKPRNQYDATDAFIDLDDDGNAVLSVLTEQAVDLTILMSHQVLEQLRSQIAFQTTQSNDPSVPPSKA